MRRRPGAATVAAVVLAVLAWPVWRAVAATATLPVDVAGGNCVWTDVGESASFFSVSDGQLINPDRGDAYDDFWWLTVGSTYYFPGSTADVTATAWGTVVTAAPVTIAGLTVTEQLAAFCFSPTLRALVTLTNPGTAPVDVTVHMSGNFGSDDATTIEASSSGDLAFGATDRWLVTSDGTDDEDSDPVNTTVCFGPGSPAEPPATATLAFDSIDASFDVSVPAGATRYLLFFSQMNATVSEATAAVGDFDSAATLASAGFLSGLTSAELAGTLNWTSLSASTPSIPCIECGNLPNGTATLPYFVPGSTWAWDSFELADEGSGPLVISDAALYSNSTDDAYDDFWGLTVGGAEYVPSANVQIASGTGSFTRLTASTVQLSGLEVTQEFIACCDDPTLAVLVTLHNPGGSDITVPLSMVGELGSDDDTTVDATASGDTAFDAADRWLVTDGDSDDPVNSFMFFGPGTPESVPTAASIVDDGIEVTFQASVPAHGTRRYLFVSRLSETVQQATDGIAHLDEVAAGGSCGLTAQDLFGVANWEPQEAGRNVPALGIAGLALLALAVAAAGVFVARRS